MKRSITKQGSAMSMVGIEMGTSFIALNHNNDILTPLLDKVSELLFR